MTLDQLAVNVAERALDAEIQRIKEFYEGTAEERAELRRARRLYFALREGSRVVQPDDEGGR